MSIDVTTLKKGDRVLIADGKPKPPKHHTRKVADWERRNFIGVFNRLDNHGYANIERPDIDIPGCISFSFTMPAKYVAELLPPESAEDAA